MAGFGLASLALGLGAWVLVLLLGVGFLLQDHNLRHRRLGFWFRLLPSVLWLSRWGLRLLALGNLGVAVAALCGAVPGGALGWTLGLWWVWGLVMLLNQCLAGAYGRRGIMVSTLGLGGFGLSLLGIVLLQSA